MSVEIHDAPPVAPARPHEPETPTQTVVRAANVEKLVALPGGHTAHFRTMRTLERMDLNSIAGPQNALNLAWMADASIAFAVTRIDGESVRKPANMLELRALIQRLGDEGMDAIGAVVRADGELMQAAHEDQNRDRAGN